MCKMLDQYADKIKGIFGVFQKHPDSVDTS